MYQNANLENPSLFSQYSFDLYQKKEIQLQRIAKGGIWLYYLLLIFEGALRKWVLPSLATPLLIVRDPVAMILIFITISRTKALSNVYVSSIIMITIISFFMAITLGHGNVFVALYGARIFILHFPMIFVIGHFFNRDDVVSLGKATLWISLFMIVLVGAQFYSPQTAWVNKAVGNEEGGGGFGGALGYYRPPGTFSFTTGCVSFFGLCSAYVIFFLISKETINRFLLITSAIAAIAFIPLSISRTALFSVSLIGAFALFGGLVSSRHFLKIIYGLTGVLILLIILSQTTFFQTATEVFTARFQDATESEGGLGGVIGNRYFGGLIGSIINSGSIPFFGYGIGMGTNAGSSLLVGSRTFLIAEVEWGRLIGEMGLLLGLLVIAMRLLITANFFSVSFKFLKRGDLLPWMMLSFAVINIPQSPWAQPTSLGFSVLIGGLVLGSVKYPRTVDKALFTKPDNSHPESKIG